LLLLLLLAATIRTWLIDHTEVIARDGVGFIRYAWELRDKPLTQVLRERPHPPVYPFAILAVSVPIREWFSGPPSVLMQFSAQLASAIAGVLLVIPMYYLGREIFDRRVAFWSTALFQCLPVGARVMSDALSEAVFLLFAVLAVLLAVRAFRRYSAVLFGLSGLCGGLAYLTRPEGALIVVATGLVVLAFQTLPAQRRPWGQALACMASLIVAAAAVGGPYVMVIGHFTNKPTGKLVAPWAFSSPPGAGRGAEAATAQRAVAGPPVAMIWAEWWLNRMEKGTVRRLLRGIWGLGNETFKGFHYVAWLPALAGLYWFRDRLRVVPGAWVLIVVGVLQMAVLLRVAYTTGYVADRHTLILVLGGLYWAVAMVLALGESVAALNRYLSHRLTGCPPFDGWAALAGSGRMWSAWLVLALAATGMPKTLEPMHLTRAGHHAAGLWLAEHTRPNDVILDPFCWAEYYAGQLFREGPSAVNPAGRPPAHYVVLGTAAHDHNPAPELPAARLYAQHGTLVYEWPIVPPPFKAETVQVFCVSAPASTR
jgi:hypothetical protein